MSEELAENVIIDLDKNGRTIGIEDWSIKKLSKAWDIGKEPNKISASPRLNTRFVLPIEVVEKG
jgi:hypothetical protein